jgi:hypothetical protein
MIRLAAGMLWSILTLDFRSSRERWLLMRLRAEFELVEVNPEDV